MLTEGPAMREQAQTLRNALRKLVCIKDPAEEVKHVCRCGNEPFFEVGGIREKAAAMYMREVEHMRESCTGAASVVTMMTTITDGALCCLYADQSYIAALNEYIGHLDRQLLDARQALNPDDAVLTKVSSYYKVACASLDKCTDDQVARDNESLRQVLATAENQRRALQQQVDGLGTMRSVKLDSAFTPMMIKVLAAVASPASLATEDPDRISPEQARFTELQYAFLRTAHEAQISKAKQVESSPSVTSSTAKSTQVEGEEAVRAKESSRVIHLRLQAYSDILNNFVLCLETLKKEYCRLRDPRRKGAKGENPEERQVAIIDNFIDTMTTSMDRTKLRAADLMMDENLDGS
ncbi:hypothetical protein CYMTET_28552 [Cymbomonas tetramitiformis]|uniref:Uncharacterized protein n=1 Tax=Cymbomonas tetramitiformis TaxID=36881 RepID=A0AAE0FMX5_9CHLO|nr:hypothetical protein CYMTET_28552 [Cymbomonas tetramitiformis]